MALSIISSSSRALPEYWCSQPGYLSDDDEYYLLLTEDK